MESGMPDDGVVNTFHILDNTVAPDFSDYMGAWRTMISGQHSLFPDQVSQSDHSFKVYDVADEEPRAPVFDDTWDFTTAPAGESLPTEVALCISYEAVRVSGLEQASRRGRIYWGPWDIQWTEGGRPTAAVISDVKNAFITFIDNLNAAGALFVVYSRKNADAQTVARVWIDNAWDTQRRRGQAATVRDSSLIDQSF